MSRVRVLVGTKKGAFVLGADGGRRKWTVEGPFFGGWEVYHVKGSPVNPERIYASQSSSWFGQIVQRSDDGGVTWEAVGNEFAYEGVAGTHQWYDGTPHPWEFKRVWHLEPSLTEAEVVFAGVEDAALFKSVDGGGSWGEVAGLRRHGSGPAWQPGAGGMCLHTIILDPVNAGRMFVAISAAGTFRTDDGGESWRPVNKGLVSAFMPDPCAEVGHCVHHIAMHPRRPGTLFMQKHWDVMRSDDAGDSWREVSGNLPTDFGFVIDVHAHEPETIYVVPIKSDQEHFPLEGKLQVFRSRSGGMEWEALTTGLPQRDCYVNVLRDAMAVDTLDECGVYFGTTGGGGLCVGGWGGPLGGDCGEFAGGVVGGGADFGMMVVVELPTGLADLARCGRLVEVGVEGVVTVRAVLEALEGRLPVLRGVVREHGTLKRRAFLRFFVCGEDWSHRGVDEVLPDAVGEGREVFMVVGAVAGG